MWYRKESGLLYVINDMRYQSGSGIFRGKDFSVNWVHTLGTLLVISPFS